MKKFMGILGALLITALTSTSHASALCPVGVTNARNWWSTQSPWNQGGCSTSWITPNRIHLVCQGGSMCSGPIGCHTWDAIGTEFGAGSSAFVQWQVWRGDQSHTGNPPAAFNSKCQPTNESPAVWWMWNNVTSL